MALSRIVGITRNPFNIRSTRDKWIGKIGEYRGFAKFSDIEYGVRAGILLLKNYIKHGFNSVSSIVSRFAPANENDTNAYIRYVEGCLTDRGYNVCNIEVGSDAFVSLVRAIAFYESGYVLSVDFYAFVVSKWNITGCYYGRQR